MISKNFGKKYKTIRILNDLNCGEKIQWSPDLTYDIETNMVIVRSLDGKDY